MGTSRIFPLLFLVVSIFRNSIFSVANDNFGEKVFNFSNGHFRIFKIYKLERCIFLEILSFLKIGCSFGYPLDKKYSIFQMRTFVFSRFTNLKDAFFRNFIFLENWM
jgi:hypothetical protein